jgi:glucokinase
VSDAYALLADVGGTNVRFALADLRAHSPLLEQTVRRFEVAHYPALTDAAQHYLDVHAPARMRPRWGVFAVAGRVEGGTARMTNHPWTLSHGDTRQALRLDGLRLINDFTAQAMAIELLGGGGLVQVGGPGAMTGRGGDRTYAVIGPGTGLGVSALLVRDGRAFALETEGGHIDFAPGTQEEHEILRVLAGRFGRVSNERLVSGEGLVNIHRALGELSGAGSRAAPLRPQEITHGAALGDVRCKRAVEIFCSVFGAMAGDLVLTLGAWDGVFLAGGLVPKLLAELQQPHFRGRFEAKGRFAEVMAGVPVMAVVYEHAGLLGAAACALRESWAGNLAAASA